MRKCFKYNMSHSHYGHYYRQESLSQEECEVWRKLHGSVRTVQSYSIVMVSVGRIHWSINFARAHTQKHSPTHALLIASHFFSTHTMYSKHFHTHMLCQNLWIWKWIYPYLLFCESSGFRLSPTHTHSHAGLHYIHWQAFMDDLWYHW